MTRPTLRWRVLLVLALAALVPTVVVGVLAILRARHDVEDEVKRGALAHIRALGQALDGTLQDARRTVELAAAQWADAPPGPDVGRSTQLLLRRLRSDVPIVQSLSIVDPNGKLEYGDAVRDVDIGSHSFGGYIGDAQLEDHGAGPRPTVHLVVQARGRTGELMGVVIASLDLGFVREILLGARLGPGARVLVVDGRGVEVATSDLVPAPAKPDPAVDRALASTVEGTLTANGIVSAYRNLSSYQSLRGVRWAILHEQPEREAYALAYTTTRDTLVIGIAALALALAFGAFFATRLTRPLADLARRADAIAAGNVVEGAAIDGPGEIGTLAHSVDEMAKRIAERAELASALARGDRLASVGVMSAQVAHEINNPLTTVLGYAKFLLEDKPEGHADRNALELIADEAERMKKIIGGLLEYARAPRPSEPMLGSAGAGTSLPEMVLRHVGELVAPQLRRAKTKLVTTVSATGPIAIEAHALQQVLVNLVQNAAQAGATTIAMTASLAPGGVATIITVSDDGPGIAPADRTKIFDPFYTTKAPGTGTGLGLAVCKHLVATAGGSIEVGDGEAGRGAEFRVVIPNAP
ncbi:MAG TPA: sensor histidine kinase [Kofleriaceae bacterium]|jgi:signal transduction histidine kinase|nr:sensor histidine kinase [Kofleriaceae bacterium]